jgi:anti-sigma factor RsiW
MHDSWIDRLSDHIDGLLSEADARELTDHLDACAECRAIELELRAVVAAAHTAPAHEPKRDLWAGIAAGIDSSSTSVSPLPDDHASAGRLFSGRDGMVRSATARRFSFSMPQLAAAAIVLMVLSGTAVRLITAPADGAAVSSGTIIQSAGDAPVSTRAVSTAVPPADYTEDIAELERALEQNRAELDPATVEVIQRSLEAINGAITAARAALAADPGNPYLHRQLDNTMRKKIDVLRRATGA